ncbi:MAG: hypothetical protein WCL50_07425 [Spirochaetota bacterium]
MRRPIAGLLYLVLGLPFALSALLALSARPWVLDRDFYKKALTDEGLYTMLRSPEARKGIDEKIVIGGFIFSGPSLAATLQKHLPEAAMKKVATGAVDSTIDLLGRGGGGEAAIDIRPLKEGLKLEATALVADYLAALPDSPLPLPANDLSFHPVGIAPASLQKSAMAVFISVIDGIPDSTRLPAPRLSRGLDSRPIFGQAALDSFAWLGSGFSFLLLIGLGFLGGGGARKSLVRSGRMMILPSAIVLAIGALLSLPGAPLIQLLPAEATAMVGSGLVEACRSWAASVLGTAARSFFVVGLVGVSIGGLLASLRRLFEPSES